MTERPPQIERILDLVRVDPCLDTEPLLHALMDETRGNSALALLASAMMDLAAPDGAQTILDRLDPATAAPLRARYDRLWNITRMPDAQTPLQNPVAGRVAYVLYLSLPWLSTGYAIRSQSVAKALTGAGAEVHCITRPGFPWDEAPHILNRPPPSPVTGVDRVEDVPYYRLPPVAAAWWVDYPAYIDAATSALVAMLRGLRPSVIVAASNHVCALPALRAARILGLPMVHDMRGLWELSRAAREPEFLASPQFFYERSLDIAVARQADHVFALSPPMRRLMIERGVAPARITYLPNGCDISRFAGQGRRAAAVTLRARLQIPASVPVIGYAGSFPDYEGLDVLVGAAALLRDRGQDFRLVLVGDEGGTGTHGLPRREVLEAQIAGLGLEGRVLMTGRIDPARVPDFLGMFDMMVVPRRSVAVTEMVAPLKPAEAMAAGKALIVSGVAGMAGLVEDGETGLVFAPGDLVALAEAMERLIRDPGLRTRLERNARRKAEETFNWDHIARRMNDVLTGLAGARG